MLTGLRLAAFLNRNLVLYLCLSLALSSIHESRARDTSAALIEEHPYFARHTKHVRNAFLSLMRRFLPLILLLSRARMKAFKPHPFSFF